MKPLEQRIAIAEVCGWKSRLVPREEGYGNATWWEHPTQNGAPPDYLNDANAMMSALTFLYERGINGMRGGQALSAYALYLDEVINRNYRGETVHRRLIATPEHQAEAFLRALNLWTLD